MVYGPVPGELMTESLLKYEKFRREAKWRPWIKGVSEEVDMTIGRKKLTMSDQALAVWLKAAEIGAEGDGGAAEEGRGKSAEREERRGRGPTLVAMIWLALTCALTMGACIAQSGRPVDLRHGNASELTRGMQPISDAMNEASWVRAGINESARRKAEWNGACERSRCHARREPIREMAYTHDAVAQVGGVCSAMNWTTHGKGGEGHAWGGGKQTTDAGCYHVTAEMQESGSADSLGGARDGNTKKRGGRARRGGEERIGVEHRQRERETRKSEHRRACAEERENRVGQRTHTSPCPANGRVRGNGRTACTQERVEHIPRDTA